MEKPEIDFNAWRTFERPGWELEENKHEVSLNRLVRQPKDVIMNAAQVNPGADVLVLSAGDGYIAAAAASLGAMVIGTDTSESKIERAWWRYPGIQFRSYHSLALPFSNSTFDAVLANFGLGSMDHSDLIKSESYRVLRPNGKFAFTEWIIDNPKIGFGLILEGIRLYGDLPAEILKWDQYKHNLNEYHIKLKLETTGFVKIKIATLPLSWFVDSVEEFVTTLTATKVSSGELLSRQSAALLPVIKSYLTDQLEPFRRGDGYDIPMPALLISATKH